eukprot:673711-Prorocentrum_minimum.AAC.1
MTWPRSPGQVNVDNVRKNKTAYTSVCRQGDALTALRAEPTPREMPVGGKYAPHIPPSESYQYLGVQ